MSNSGKPNQPTQEQSTLENNPETTHILPKALIDRPANEIPINEKDFEDFRTWFCETPQDTELFFKIFNNLRMLDEQEFDFGVRQIETAVAEFVVDSPYYLIFDGKGKGGDLMLDKLNLEAFPPTIVLRMFENETWPDPVDIPQDAKFVFIDDVTLSGAYAHSMRDAFSKKYDITAENSMFATVAATNGADEYLHKIGFNNTFSTYHIPVSSEILTEEEMQQLYKRYARVNEHWNLGHRVLTFMYYKVPDNFMAGFTSHQPVAVFNRDSTTGPWEFVAPDYHYMINSGPGGIYPYYKLNED